MKKLGYLLLVLFVLTLAACWDEPTNGTTLDNSSDVVTGGEDEPTSGDVVTTPDQTTDEITGGDDVTTGGEESEEVVVLKAKDSFELELEDSIDVDLTEYLSYAGSKYQYEISASNNVVSYELLNDTLTIYAEASGEATIVITLNDKSVELTVVVAGEILAPTFDDVEVSYDLSYETVKEVTLAPKEANGHTELTYALKESVDNVAISETILTVSIAEVCEKNVTVVCTYGVDMTVEFNVHIIITESDLTVRNVVNGSFDNGLEGWVLEGEIGGITENATFWAQGFPMFNVGKYFDGHAGLEANHGTLTSNTFELSATGYLTFMLGGAGNEECYIKVLDNQDNVLAIYRNTEFADFKPEHEGLTDEEKRALIGTEVNACNLVKYKANLSEHLGKEIKIVVVDNAEAGFGLVFLDEVVAYHETIPGDEYVLATNQLADVTELKALLETEVTAQGDYTAQSFAAYQEAITNAKNQVNNIAITEAKIAALIEAINNAYEALALREIEVLEAETAKQVIVGKTLSLNYGDYFNTNELSNVTFNATSDKALVKEEATVSVNTTDFDLTTFTITLEALYKGEVKQTVEITVEVMARPTATVKEATITQSLDLCFDAKKYSVDLAENVNVIGELSLTYFVNEEALEGTVYTCELSEGTVTLNVKATYVYEEETYEITYTITLNVTDTTKYRVVNGSFDNDLEGWTMTGGEIGAVSENATFWGEAYPMHNVGKYFDAYGKNDLEPNKGSLTSSSFVLGGTGYISFMFGGAGNEECYIKVLNSEDEVIAIYRNTRFADFKPEHQGLTVEEKRTLIGNEVFLANLVKYQADLSRYIGQELRLVVVDNASSGWGVVYFDELHTYHTEALGDEYLLAENQLANLEALNTLLANEITAQGDYTEQSFVAYQAAINNAKEQMNKEAIRQHVVDILVAQINEAYSNLALREIEVLAADTNLSVIVDKTLTIDYTTYFNTNGLSSVTFNYVSDKTLTVEGTKLTYSSAVALEFTITLEALYKDEVKQTVELTVKVTNDPTPILKTTTLTENVDTYGYENDVYTYDLSSNVINNAGLALTYYVGEEVVENGIYTHALTNLGEFELNVRVQYVVGSETLELEFALMLNLFDTTKYRLINGDFETGDLTGWTLVGQMGAVSNNTHYWIGDGESAAGFAYGKEGNYFFDAYAGGVEGKVGSLTSSTFTVGGSGYITYKIGAAKNLDQVNIQVVEAATGNILKVLGNPLWADRTDGVKSGCTLIAYKADLSELMGKEVFIRVWDNATSDYGLFFLDSVYTYYAEEPTNYNVATLNEGTGNIYALTNGGFETGDLTGWTLIGNLGAVSNNTNYWIGDGESADGFAYGKVGEFLFDAYAGGVEGELGSLTSSRFVIGGSGFITYKIGGAKNIDVVHIEVIDATNGNILTIIGNDRWADRTDGIKSGCTLVSYKADLSQFIGKDVYLKVVDNASGDYGLFFLDDVVTYYAEEPADYNLAVPYLTYNQYQVTNGDFEKGNLIGWTCVEGEIPGEVLNGSNYFNGNSLNKDGEWSFQAIEIQGSGYNTEKRRGIVRSSTFVLKENSKFSFKLSGGTGDVGIRVINAATGEVLGVFKNDQRADIEFGEGQLVQYHYQFENAAEVECYIEIFDHLEGGWGLVGVDSLNINVESFIEGSKLANNLK